MTHARQIVEDVPVMQVQVLFFGGLRDALGCSSQQLTFEGANEVSLEVVQRTLLHTHPRLPQLLTGVRYAVNECFVDASADAPAASVILSDRDVLAYIPPVTGG